ncbi:hypothetical protein C8R44DRAFT_211326 [Mycena epipterygia]|nr:hypothetical protein C8R44DRAFT_211326 [Mycena epipterygia]
MPASDVPSSSSYPNLITIPRMIHGSPKLLPGKNLPYKNVDGKVVYYEFRGRGTPPVDVGRPGDIYWDVTPPYIIYIRDIDGWEPWNRQASAGSQPLAQHPNLDDRYLWISGLDCSWCWFTIKTLGRKRVEANHAMDENMQETLASFLHWLKMYSAPGLNLDLPENQRRHAAEIKRRLLNGVTVGEVPKTNPRIHPRKIMKANHTAITSKSNMESEEELPAFGVGTRLTQREILSAEVETLKKENLGLEASLEEAEERCRAAEFSRLVEVLEVEGVSRTLKRKYEEELEASAREAKELSIRHDIAHERIKELERAWRDGAENGSRRELELRTRLNAAEDTIKKLEGTQEEARLLRKRLGTAEHTIGKLEGELSRKEDEFKNGLYTFAVSVREIAGDLDVYLV